MLSKPSPEVAVCLERAACCRETADKTTCPKAREDYLFLEQKWMKLARSKMWLQSVEDFLTAFRTKYTRIIVACL